MPAEGGGPRLRMAVLGAGPVGLEAALAAVERGYDVRVYESGSRPAANVRAWGHVRLFTPWRMNLSPRMRAALEDSGAVPDVDGDETPTGHELADAVFDRLWATEPLRDGLRCGVRVAAVGRENTLKHEEIGTPVRGSRPFRLLLRASEGGREWVEHADVVLDCTGKYGHPNTLGDGGIPAPGEATLADRIHRAIPDPQREAGAWEDRTVLLAGAGHSAQTAALTLAGLAERRPATRVVWAVRREAPDWGAVPDDSLPVRAALTRDARALAGGASPAVEAVEGAVVDALEDDGGRTTVTLRHVDGTRGRVVVDRILSLTGGVGDHGIYRQLQVHECYATSGPMKLSAALLGASSADCLEQESHGADTLVNPEPGFFLLGDKSYGRNNTFLMRTGWAQVDEIFGTFDG